MSQYRWLARSAYGLQQAMFVPVPSQSRGQEQQALIEALTARITTSRRINNHDVDRTAEELASDFTAMGHSIALITDVIAGSCYRL